MARKSKQTLKIKWFSELICRKIRSDLHPGHDEEDKRSVVKLITLTVISSHVFIELTLVEKVSVPSDLTAAEASFGTSDFERVFWFSGSDMFNIQMTTA